MLRLQWNAARHALGPCRIYAPCSIDWIVAVETVRHSVHKHGAAHEQLNMTTGRSSKKVTSRKLAIAIGLSKAREQGEKVLAKRP
jgi:hypothetical protein